MATLDIDAIEARANAATVGPWVADKGGAGVDTRAVPRHLPGDQPHRTSGYNADNRFICDLNDGEYHIYRDKAEQRANAAFIAHAREDIPELVAEVRMLRALIGGGA